MTDVCFSVIVATNGRPTLARTLASVARQLRPGDELLVRCSDDGDFGCAARRSLIPRAAGTHLAFIDDDDRYTRRALTVMRRFARAHPDRIGIFRMRFGDGRLLWLDPVLRLGNVSTQVLLVPNRPEGLGTWSAEDPYNGDFEFVRAAAERQGPPVFRKEIVAYARFDRPLPVLVFRRVRRLRRELRFRLALRTRVRRYFTREGS